MNNKYNSGNFKSAVFSLDVAQKMFDKQANDDTQWAVFSVLFVFLYFIYHLESVTLSAVGIVLILFSFPFTAVIS